MGAALEHLSGSIGNNAALTNVTMATGDSLTLRAVADQSKGIWLLTSWAMVEAAFIYEIHSPRMHDNVHGIRVRGPANTAVPETSLYNPTRMYTLDTIVVQLAGTSGAGSVSPMSWMVYYEDLPGVQAQLMSLADLSKQGVNYMAQEVVVTGVATGTYSTAVALNANFDFTKANKFYALLGFTVDINGAAICLRGADTGNLRVAAPGINTLPQVTAEWFPRLSQRTGMNLIPKLNANNKGSILIDNLMNHNGGTFNIQVHLMELAS